MLQQLKPLQKLTEAVWQRPQIIALDGGAEWEIVGWAGSGTYLTERGIGQQGGTTKCGDNGGGAEISGDGTIDDGKSANSTRGRRDCGQDTERPEGTFLEAPEEHVV